MGGYGIILKKNYNYKYVLAILNSNVCYFHISKISVLFRGNYYSYESRFIKQLIIPYALESTQNNFSFITDFLLSRNLNIDFFELLVKGMVYELYFGEEMKKVGVDILALVGKDLEAVKKLSPEKAIAKLYSTWQEPKNEVRNRLLLMSTRCPTTIGVIEASVR